jgi:hypothetical protein
MAIVLTALIIFVAGVVAGGYLLVIIGIHKEERRRTFLHRWAPGRSSQAARPVTGLWARRQIDADPAPDRREDMLV